MPWYLQAEFQGAKNARPVSNVARGRSTKGVARLDWYAEIYPGP
jgi:hypothetical protein